MNKTHVGILIIILIMNSISFAISENFNKTIDTMGIDTTNINGKIINEEIYNTYSLIVYGSPLDGYLNQRWKEVNDGKWKKNSNSRYNGEGIRGEYWILGENSHGYEVHNHKFPVDIEPPSSPETWRYAILNDAKSSWEDQSKYMDDSQKEYMINTNLTRNNTSYNIKIPDIGYDKVRLENYATWKTFGTVYTQRYDKQNRKWAANFMVPPMAADSTIECFAEFEKGKTIVPAENETIIDIPITFGANAINIGEYARDTHVKLIEAELLINGESMTKVTDSSILSVSKEFLYSYEKQETDDVVILDVTVNSILLTKFSTDGPLTDSKNFIIAIYFSGVPQQNDYIESNTYYNNVISENYAEYEEIPPPYISEIKIEKYDSDKKSNLFTSRKTGTKFICAGQTIKITATVENFTKNLSISFEGDSSIFTFDELTKRFEWDEPKTRNIKPRFPSLYIYKEMFTKTNTVQASSTKDNTSTFEFVYIIPYGTKQTLHSWQTLRKETQNALEIDENRLFSRIKKPYEIVVKAQNINGADTKRIELDVFERWDTLYNRDISKYIK